MVKNLQDLVNSKNISEEGADWLRTALDPFHDYNKVFEGYPDIVSSRSKVHLVTVSHTISSPDGNPYKCRIWHPTAHPILAAKNDLHPIAGAGTGIVGINTAATTMGTSGPIMVETWNGTSNPDSTPVGATCTRAGLGWPGVSDVSDHRIVAIGWEVHNTTSPVYQSGTITVSRQTGNSSQCVPTIIEDGVNAIPSEMQSVRFIDNPYASSNLAIATPGAVQWPASEGCYVVGKLASPNLHINSVTNRQIGINLGSHFSTTSYWATETAVVAGVDAVDHITGEPLSISGFDMPYVLGEGLSGETTLQLTCRIFYELFPSGGSELAMSTPSPKLDYKALALYGEVAAHLPCAVPVAMNPGGDYFRMVMAAIAEALRATSPLLATFHPALGPAAVAGSIVAQQLSKKGNNNNNNANKQKKKKKPARVGWGTLSGTPSSSYKK
jgi:hypothetical protein